MELASTNPTFDLLGMLGKQFGAFRCLQGSYLITQVPQTLFPALRHVGKDSLPDTGFEILAIRTEGMIILEGFQDYPGLEYC